MPFPAANRLYHVIYAPQGVPEPRGVAALDWKSLSEVVEVADASTLARFYLGEGAEKREALGLSVAPGASEILGVRTVLGRSFLAEEYRAESEKVALIGYALWQERFGGDPNIVGRSFQASRSNLAEPLETFRIVGVLPPDFHYAREYARGVMEFAVPLTTPRQAYMVRLRPGVPTTLAEQTITAAIKTTGSNFPPNWQGVKLESMHERYVRELRPMLLPVALATGLVLVIVCVNVAVLLLLRALRRQKEMAVRVALGAGRGHIVRMLMTETCLLCGAALVGGLALTSFALRLLAPVVEERLGRGAPGGTSAIALDPAVLLMVGGVGVLIALSLSFIPLLTPWEKRLADTLRREGRSGTDGPATRRLRSGLIALEVGLSLALLVGCGLMIRSVVHLVRTDLGFQTEHVVRARIALPNRTYPDEKSFQQFYERLNERLAATMNVPFALTNFIPLCTALLAHGSLFRCLVGNTAHDGSGTGSRSAGERGQHVRAGSGKVIGRAQISDGDSNGLCAVCGPAGFAGDLRRHGVWRATTRTRNRHSHRTWRHARCGITAVFAAGWPCTNNGNSRWIDCRRRHRQDPGEPTARSAAIRSGDLRWRLCLTGGGRCIGDMVACQTRCQPKPDDFPE